MVQTPQTSPVAEESLDSRLKTVAEQAAKGCGASYAFLLLRDQDTSELCHAAWYGCQEAPDSCAAAVQWVLSRGEPLYLQGEGEAKQIVGCGLDKKLLPLICAPVMSNAIPLGVLGVGLPHAAGEEFRRCLPLIESMAELAGALLENEALQRNLNHREEQVQNLIRDTLDAHEAQRERISLEIHDGVTQTLVSAFQYLQTLETTSLEHTDTRQLFLRASALVKQSIQELREVINSLQPAILRDLGLVATLRQEMRQLKQELEWEIEFKADVTRLPKDVETGLYRIIREAITNARKHSDTKRLRVMLTPADDRVKVEVRDWGIGFSCKPYGRATRRGTGLLSMRKRAELLQGTCEIESTPGQGTTVRVEIPFSG